jgi:hypothetical protein
MILALKCLLGGFGMLSFGLECFGPEYPLSADGVVPESPVITANIFSIWVSFMLSLCQSSLSHSQM